VLENQHHYRPKDGQLSTRSDVLGRADRLLSSDRQKIKKGYAPRQTREQRDKEKNYVNRAKVEKKQKQLETLNPSWKRGVLE